MALNKEHIVDMAPRGVINGTAKGAIFTTVSGEKIYYPPTIKELDIAEDTSSIFDQLLSY